MNEVVLLKVMCVLTGKTDHHNNTRTCDWHIIFVQHSAVIFTFITSDRPKSFTKMLIDYFTIVSSFF